MSISKVILSHAHFDHVGNCGLFAKSTLIVQSVELDAMFGPDYAHFGYIRGTANGRRSTSSRRS